MPITDFIFKMIDLHPFWLFWFTAIPVVCCFAFAETFESDSCCDESCVNFRKKEN